MKLLTIAWIFLIGIKLSAQDCEQFYFLQKNKIVENTNYNKKGTITGKKVYNVIQVLNSENETKATIKTEIFEADNKSLGNINTIVKCINGVLMLDMKMKLPPKQQEQVILDSEIIYENAFIEYPHNLKPGDNLKEATFEMQMVVNDMTQQMVLLIHDRQVETFEKIITAAGSWKAFKINYKTKMTIKTLGTSIPINSTGSEWFAPGFGIIKTLSSYGSSEVTLIK